MAAARRRSRVWRGWLHAGVAERRALPADRLRGAALDAGRGVGVPAATVGRRLCQRRAAEDRRPLERADRAAKRPDPQSPMTTTTGNVARTLFLTILVLATVLRLGYGVARH